MKHQLLPAVIFLLLLSRSPAGAEELSLGSRIGFDALKTTPHQLDVDRGMSISILPEGAVVTLQSEASGSVAPQQRLAEDSEATITLKLAERTGDLSAQVEWLDENGQFLDAIPCLDPTTADAGLADRKIADFPSKMRDRASKFRIKLWLGGANAQATIREFRILTPRRWQQEEPVRLIHIYNGKSKIEPDKGMVVTQDGTDLLARIEPGIPYSAVVLVDRAEYSPNGVVMLDVAALQGSTSLQALCWDAAGKHLKAVDLMKDVLEAGTYEVPLSIYADQIPPETKTISFKLWLGGPEAEARVQGIFYGTADEHQ